MFYKTLAPMIAVASIISGGPALAQAKPVTLSADVMLERTLDDGIEQKRELVAPVGVVPGDMLVFTTSYRNAGGETVTDFVIVNPVPSSVQVTSETVSETEVSVDGGTNWGRLDQLAVADDAGAERAATNEDVTHLRWTIASLTPGQSGSVSYRATVR